MKCSLSTIFPGTEPVLCPFVVFEGDSFEMNALVTRFTTCSKQLANSQSISNLKFKD